MTFPAFAACPLGGAPRIRLRAFMILAGLLTVTMLAPLFLLLPRNTWFEPAV